MFQIKCIDFSVAIVYILLVAAFFGWVLFHRKRERRRTGSTKEPLLSAIDDDDINPVNLQNDESFARKVSLILIFLFYSVLLMFLPITYDKFSVPIFFKEF